MTTEATVEKKVKKLTPVATATGRRKTSNARVRLFDGTGQVTINGEKSTDYLHRPTLQMHIMEPMELLQCATKYDVFANVAGGGKAGQAGAIRHGISRCLAQVDEKFQVELRKGPFMTRDSRMKERKKYGQRGARRRFQFSKR
ncbi:MAG: 30S ribosomal protein S9 [Candidatus Omnitrophica bacterium]|jgi:small subunit ribosomal protein S9|nr:30S ribosomal protein S9 [Candidatus Omnitrophota bacterium]